MRTRSATCGVAPPKKATPSSCGRRPTTGGRPRGPDGDVPMLAIDPAAVRLEHAEAGCTDPLSELCPVYAAAGYARYRPTACWEIQRVQTQTRAAPSWRASCTISTPRCRHGGPRHEPGCCSDRRRAWHRRRHRRRVVAAGWQVVAVDRSADDPALDYPLATKAQLEAVAPLGTAMRCGRSSATFAVFGHAGRGR